MAFGKGKESAGTGGSSFVRHEGIGVFEVIAVNPDAKELKELTGKDQEQEPNYIIERDGKKSVRVSVWLRNVTGGATSNFITQANFFLDGQLKESQNGNIKVIDKYGLSRFIPKENFENKTLPENAVLSKTFKACAGDEDLLIGLLRAQINLRKPDYYNKEEQKYMLRSEDELKDQDSMLEHVKDYFKGDFSELKEAIKIQPENKIHALLYPMERDGKTYQGVFIHCFTPEWDDYFQAFEKAYEKNKEYAYRNSTITYFGPLREVVTTVTPTNLAQPTVDLADQINQGIPVQDDDLPF